MAREEDRKKQDMIAAILVREKPKDTGKNVLYLGRAQRWGIRIAVQTQQVPDGKVCNGNGRGSASTGTGTGLAPELYGAQGALLRACSGTRRGIQR